MIMEGMPSLESKDGPPSDSSPVSAFTSVPSMASEHGFPSSQSLRPVPAVALAPTTRELVLSPNNCPNCKLLNRHLRVSREWNNFFRLKLDQRDMLLHVASDYKRQKQRCLQLQMALDQQTRECGEMREQLTNLLLEINPLRDRVQVAEKNADEERKRREKAESDEYNLHFLVKQQTYKIEHFEKKCQSYLVETLEKKLNSLRAEIKRLKAEEVHKSRVEWKLRETVSCAHELEVRALKKAYWGLTLARKYGICLLRQDQLQEGKSPQEWNLLQNLLEQIANSLHREYLALGREAPVRQLKEVWLNDFHAKDCQSSSGVEDSGAKHLESLIQDGFEEEIPEEIKEEGTKKMGQNEMIKTKLVSKNNEPSSTDQGEVVSAYIHDGSSNDSDSDSLDISQNDAGEVKTDIQEIFPCIVDTSIRKKTQKLTKSSSILDTCMENSGNDPSPRLQDSTQEPKSDVPSHLLDTEIRKKNQKLIKSSSILDTSIEDSDSDPLPSLQDCAGVAKRNVQEVPPHVLDTEIKRKNEKLVKPSSILDTSVEDSDSDPLPRLQDGAGVAKSDVQEAPPHVLDTEIRRKNEKLVKPSSILDTSTEDSDSDPLPRVQDDAGVAKINVQVPLHVMDTEIKKKNQKQTKSTSIQDTSTDSDPLSKHQNVAEEAGSHTICKGIKEKTEELCKLTSTLDTSIEDCGEEPLPRRQANIHVEAGSLLDMVMIDTGELSASTTTLDVSMTDGQSDSHANADKATSSVISYHLDEELKAILQKMRPHEKLEGMDVSLSQESSPLLEADLHGLDMKQDLLGSLSDSEEEKEERQIQREDAESEERVGTCVVPRILTSQISEGFTAPKSQKDSSLLDDLDISTDTVDQGVDEKEEDIQKRVVLPHFQSSQGFSFDLEESHSIPNFLQKPISEGEASEEQHIICHSQFPCSVVDNTHSNTHAHQTHTPKIQNKTLLTKLRHLFGTVDDVTIVDGEAVDVEPDVGSITAEDNFSSNSEGDVLTEICQAGQLFPKIPVTTDILLKISKEKDVATGTESIAGQKETGKREERPLEVEEENCYSTVEEERPLEVEEENCYSTVENKTMGLEKEICVVNKEKIVAVIDRFRENAEATPLEKEEQTTEAGEKRDMKIQEERFTLTVEGSTAAKEEGILQAELINTTKNLEKEISKLEEEGNIKAKKVRNTRIKRQTSMEAEEGKIRDEEEKNTEVEEERTTEPMQEKSTGTEDERSSEVVGVRTTGWEEERATEIEKEETTGSVTKEKYTIILEKRSTEVVEDKSERIKDKKTVGEGQTTRVEDTNTIGIEKKQTTAEKERNAKDEQERNTQICEEKNALTRKRTMRIRVSDFQKEESSQKEEEKADKCVERNEWANRLRGNRKKSSQLEDKTQNNNKNLRQHVQTKDEIKFEKIKSVPGKRNRKKLQEVEKIKGKNERKIHNTEQKKSKEEDKEKQEEGEKRKQERGKRKIIVEETERHEQKRRKSEYDELYSNAEKEQCKLELKQMNEKGEKEERKQQEKQKIVSEISKCTAKNSVSLRENDTKEPQREEIDETIKRQEKVVFSWNMKRKQYRKLIKFHKQSRLVKILPDPLGSQHHSVFSLEFRIQRSERDWLGRSSMESGQAVRGASSGTPEVPIRCGLESEEGKESNPEKARDSIEIPVRKIRQSSRKQNIMKSGRKRLWEKETYRSEESMKMESRGRMRSSSTSSSSSRNSSSSSFSDERKILCSFPRKCNNRGRTSKQVCDNKKTTLSGCTRVAHHHRRVRPHKTRASKVYLHSTDSDSSGDTEGKKEKEQVKNRRERKQQQPSGIVHNKSNNSSKTSSLTVTTKGNGNSKSIEENQITTAKGISSSYSSLPTCQATNYSADERQDSANQGTECTTSDSDMPLQPASRKRRSMVIESESEDPQNDMSSIVYSRRRRKRRMDYGTDSNSNDDCHSPVEQRRHSTSSCSTADHYTCGMIQNKKQVEVYEELSLATSPTSILAITPKSIKRKPSKVLRAQQEKHVSVTERRHQLVPRKCINPPSSSLEQQNEMKPILKGYQKPQLNPESPALFQNIGKRRKRDGCNVEEDDDNTLVMSQMDDDTSLVPEDGDNGLAMQGESGTQALSESCAQDQTDVLAQTKSDGDSSDELVIEENFGNSSDSSMQNTSKFNQDISQSKIISTNVSQEGQVLKTSHLGPVVLANRPKFTQKFVPTPKLTSTPTSVPAGPEYIEKLFSRLSQRTKRCSTESIQDNHATQLQETSNSLVRETCSPNHPHINKPARGIDYQGQSPVLLPNMYGTLGPAPTIEKPKPNPTTTLSHCKADPPSQAHHPALLSSSLNPSSTEQDQPHATPSQSPSTSNQPPFTPGTSQLPTLQPHPIRAQHPHCADTSSLPEYHVPELQWLPEIAPERVMHPSKQQEEINVPLAMEDLEETLEEVVASRIQSQWWKMGLNKICTSISTTTLPGFLRFVLKAILSSDPLEPQNQPDSLPPRLYRLFQVVCVVEQRLAPQHPHSLRSALLRAIQAIITKPDIRITPHSLASLTAWYVASASIDNHIKAGEGWRRARTFFVDLLFYHPGTSHLALLTVVRTSCRFFRRFMQHKDASGLEQVILWLVHYGAWIGRPVVRSDLIKWLSEHSIKKPPQSPSTLAKNLVKLLTSEKSKDWYWGAAIGLIVLVRWQGRSWTQKHLLPALVSATAEIPTKASQLEESSSAIAASKLHEDLKIRISCLFGNLHRALPPIQEEKIPDDVVKKIEDAVTTLFCQLPDSDCLSPTT